MRMLTRHAEEIFGSAWENEGFRDAITPVDITPVAKWFYEENTKQKYRVDEDFARVSPPWPVTWIEFVPPDQINQNGNLTDWPLMETNRMGTFILASEIDEPSGGYHPVPKLMEKLYPGFDIPESAKDKVKIPPDAAWWVCNRIFKGAKSYVVELGSVFDFLDDQGEVILSDEHRLFAPGPSLARDVQTGKVDQSEVIHMLNSLTFPFYFALSLCHCNNVEVGEDSVPKAVRENRKSKGQNPGKTFKTLEIDPMKEESQSSASAGQSSVDRALHICRGHFKTYTEEAPLFGEHTGTYWWPMHTRGSADAGEVEKDYKVNQPSK